MRRFAPFALVALVAALAGCGDPRPQPLPRDQRVLLVGIDGLEWTVLLKLMEAGDLPTFRELTGRGVYGELATSRPTFSPIIWTSIATGKIPAKHGIRGFVRKQREGEGTGRLFNSYDRRTKALWNILSDAGRSVAVIGWWMTYPAEPVNGLMVAQAHTLDQADRGDGRAILKGSLIPGLPDQVHPEQRREEILNLHRQAADDLPRLTGRIFGDFPHPLTPIGQRLWENTQWAFAADAAYERITLRVAPEDWDLLAFYLGGADVTGHRFWRYMEPESYAYPPSAAEIENFGNLIPAYYRYLDEAVGRVLAALPASTNVIIVSDHGMRAVNRKRRFDIDGSGGGAYLSGHHHKATPGVFIAAGPAFPDPTPDESALPQRSELPSVGSVLDVTPTLLTLLRLPVGADMDGRALTEILDPQLASLVTIPSHDSPEWLASRADLDAGAIAPNEQRMEQLRALGYID